MITATKLEDYLWKVDVSMDEKNVVGQTTVCCDTQEEAEEYGQVFLSDIRRNNPRTLKNVVFEWEEVEKDDNGKTILQDFTVK